MSEWLKDIGWIIKRMDATRDGGVSNLERHQLEISAAQTDALESIAESLKKFAPGPNKALVEWDNTGWKLYCPIEVGDIVFHVSDPKGECPMTVTAVEPDRDCRDQWQVSVTEERVRGGLKLGKFEGLFHWPSCPGEGIYKR